MGKIIPNTFMCPNAHVDEAMQYLSGDEYKVLNFAVRHIYGWQDESERKVSQISLSVFQNGYITKTGKRFFGTGLGRKTIVDCLAELTRFKLLEVVDKKTGIGKAKTYKVGPEPDWDALTTRANEQLEVNRARTEKARANRKAGLSHKPEPGLSDKPVMSDEPVLSDKPEPVMSHKPEPGLSDKPNLFHKANKTITAHSDEQPLTLLDKPAPTNEWYDAVHEVWGYEAGRNGDYSQWLKNGKSSKVRFKDYPIEPPITAAELLEWSKDWRKLYPTLDKMVSDPAKVQESIIKWRRYKADQPQRDAAAEKRRADLQETIRINRMIATGNYDETEAAS